MELVEIKDENTVYYLITFYESCYDKQREKINEGNEKMYKIMHSLETVDREMYLRLIILEFCIA